MNDPYGPQNPESGDTSSNGGNPQFGASPTPQSGGAPQQPSSSPWQSHQPGNPPPSSFGGPTPGQSATPSSFPNGGQQPSASTYGGYNPPPSAQGGSGYPANPAGGYQPGYGQTPPAGQPQGGWNGGGPTGQYPTPGVPAANTGTKVQALPVVSTAFRTFFQNALPPILVSLVVFVPLVAMMAIVFVMSLVFGESQGGDASYEYSLEYSQSADTSSAGAFAVMAVFVIGSIAMIILTAVQTIAMFNGTNAMAAGQKPTFKDFWKLQFGYVKPLIVLVTAHIIPAIAVTIAMIPMFGIFAAVLSSPDADPSLAFGGFFGALTLLLVVIFLLIFITPFLIFPVFYVVDLNCGIKEAFVRAFHDVKPNYFPIIGALFLIMLLLSAANSFTAGLANVVLAPLFTVACALMYRKMSGASVVPIQ